MRTCGFKSRLAHQRDSRKTVSFFVSPSWPKPVRKPFVDEKRVFSILLSPALIVASVCKYCHLFCRCTVGLDATQKSLVLPCPGLPLRNLQRYFTVKLILSSVQPTRNSQPYQLVFQIYILSIPLWIDLMSSIGDFLFWSKQYGTYGQTHGHAHQIIVRDTL